jgi:hypothetical protein
MKTVGILGSGPVGKALAKGFSKYGHQVMIGTRDKSRLDEWIVENPYAKSGTFDEVAKHGEILVLAVAGRVAKEVLNSSGRSNLSGKVIIDATNPISNDPPQNGVLQFFTDLNHSLMEDLQTEYPDAMFVKAFNSVGNPFMVDPDFEEGKPTMFICGNDLKAKSEVETILEKFGWEVENMGGAEAARAIEPLCILWCLPGFLRNQWNHAFKLLKK